MAGIYIHIPFCKRACHYCNFHFSTSLRYKEDLIAGIIREMELKAPAWAEIQFQTIYFGGGTPSMLDEVELSLIINALRKNFNIASIIECTLEANPDDIDAKQLTSFVDAGINRISLGTQTFDNELLRSMNRAHDRDMAIKALDLIQSSDIENVSCDLIFGIMDQSDHSLKKDLDILLSYDVDHISAYALTIERKTALHAFIQSGKSNDISQKDQARQFYIIDGFLTDAEYDHYEVSNYAKNQKLAKHNSSYWHGKAYLGLGPSAHSFFEHTRSWNIANNVKYIEAIQVGNIPCESEELSITDRFNEMIMTGLRTKWGIDKASLLTFPKRHQDYLNAEIRLKFLSGDIIDQAQTYTIAPDKWIYADRISSDLFFVG